MTLRRTTIHFHRLGGAAFIAVGIALPLLFAVGVLPPKV